ncbi:MAG: hypothetical protein HYZ51_00470 [Candidatus Doudnabacteria bacterium]|nr:hypothetical protein [Candidatus Doudnabacteria bacterium]
MSKKTIISVIVTLAGVVVLALMFLNQFGHKGINRAPMARQEQPPAAKSLDTAVQKENLDESINAIEALESLGID